MTEPIVNGSTVPPVVIDRSNIPDWVRKEISDANDEAASRRVELRDKSTELASVNAQVQTLTEEKVTATTRADTAETAYLKLTVALSAGVPGEQAAEFAELLQGTTEDELKAHAEKIRKFGATGSAPGRAVDPSQGLGNSGASANSTNTPLSPGAAAFADMVRGQLSR